MNKELIEMRVSDLIPYANNPRDNSKAVDPVSESIRQTGYNNPILVDENNVILAGHTRRLALMKQNVQTAQVIRISGMTEEQKKKYRLLDNKTGELASWDYVALEEELDGLDFDGLELDWGLDGGDDSETEFVNKEYDPEVFDDDKFDYECPHCGFRFNEKESK